MASFSKFNPFVQDLGRKVHNLNADTLKLLLITATTSPTSADGTYDDASAHTLNSSGAAEVANGNGYTAGGSTIGSTSYSQSSGTATLACTSSAITWTASGAGFSLRYVVAYNSSAGSSGARPLIGWWDYGSTVTLAAGESFSVTFGSASILTLN